MRLQVTLEGLARGLGLRVLDVGPSGLVLGALDESPFALRMADYRQNLGAEDRMVHGLIQLAIAAWCFPTAQSLDDPTRTVVALTAPDVVGYLKELAQKLKSQADQDPELASPELKEAWRVVLALPETRSTQDSRRASGTLKGMVEYALERLEQAGLLKASKDAENMTYRTLAAYRIQVRELGALDAFRWIQETRRRCAAGSTAASQEEN